MFFYIFCGISTHAICRGGLPIVARKFIRKILAAAVVALWRTRFRWCGEARRREWAMRGSSRRDGSNTKPESDRPMWGCTIENKIDNSFAGPRSTCSIPLVCQSRRGVIGDAECANCRRSTTRIYRAGVAAGSPSRRTCVRIKTYLDGTIVNAISIAVTTPLQYPTDIVD